MICSHCHQDRPLFYKDFVRGTSESPAQAIQVCFECALELGFSEAIKERLHVRLCNKCNCKFLPRRTEEFVCYVCKNKAKQVPIKVKAQRAAPKAEMQGALF